MERHKPSSSRRRTSLDKSYRSTDDNDRQESEKRDSSSPDPGTSKTDYTSMFSLTDPEMMTRFQRESYTSDAEEESSEDVNPIADDNDDQTFSEYRTPERLMEPDGEAVLAYLRESARTKRGIIVSESDETETVTNKSESTSIGPRNKRSRKSGTEKKRKSSVVVDNPEFSGNPESPKDLKVIVDTITESGPSSVTSSTPSDFGKFRKKKGERKELWKNYTVDQMIKASFIVTVEPAKNLKEGPICQLIMTKDCNGQATEDARPPMTFTDYEFSSDSEPEENGYYFRKLYRHNPNLRPTKTKIDELKEQIAPEKFVKRIRHAITYDTKDEIAKWRKPVRKPFPSFYYPVQFVVPQKNPLQKLPKREYMKIRGLRPRSSSVISIEQMEPAILRTEKKMRVRRRRSCSPPRPSPVYRLCHTIMTDYLLADERYEKFDMSIDPRRFKEGRFVENVVVMWCDYYLKMIKRARRKGIKMTIPPLLKLTDPYPKWKLDEDCRNLVAAKKWPKCLSWQSDLIKTISGILFPEEVHFMLRGEMMTYSGKVRREAERLLNTFLQRELCTRNAMETVFALMLAKPKEFQTVKNFSKNLVEMTDWIFRKGRIPFGFFDNMLPKRFIPRQPMAACNYCSDAILAAIELVPSIVNIFQQDDVDVTARIQRKRQNRVKKLPAESEFTDTLESSNALIEAEKNADVPPNVVKNTAEEQSTKNIHDITIKKPRLSELESEQLLESATEIEPITIHNISREFSPKFPDSIDIRVEEVVKARSISFSPELEFGNDSSTPIIPNTDRIEMETAETIHSLKEKTRTPVRTKSPDEHSPRKSSARERSEKTNATNTVSKILLEERVLFGDQDIPLEEKNTRNKPMDELIEVISPNDELEPCPISQYIYQEQPDIDDALEALGEFLVIEEEHTIDTISTEDSSKITSKKATTHVESTDVISLDESNYTVTKSPHTSSLQCHQFSKKSSSNTIEIKDPKDSTSKLMSEKPVKEPKDLLSELETQVIQYTSDDGLKEMKNAVIFEKSPEKLITSYTEPMMIKYNAEEVPKETSLVNECLSSKILLLNSEDREPVAKKRRLNPVTTSIDVNLEVSPISIETCEVIIPDDTRVSVSAHIEKEDGEIFDSDEEEQELFVVEENRQMITHGGIETVNSSNNGQISNDCIWKKKETINHFKLPFDLQQNFFNENKLKPTFPKVKRSLNQMVHQQIRGIPRNPSITLDSNIHQSSTAYQHTIPTSDVNATLSSEKVVARGTPKGLSTSNSKITIPGIPAITGSYTIIQSTPSNSNTTIMKKKSKASNIQNKIKSEEIFEVVISYSDPEENSMPLPAFKFNINQPSKPEVITLDSDVPISKQSSQLLSEPQVSSEYNSSFSKVKNIPNKQPQGLNNQISHNTSHMKVKENRILSLVSSNSDLLLVLRVGKEKEILQYLTSLETGITLKTPSNIKPIPLSNLIGIPHCHSAKVTDVKYYRRFGRSKDQLSSLENLNIGDIYEVNREKIIICCRSVGEDSVYCQGVKAHQSKYIFVWEHTGIGWILTKRLHSMINLSLQEPFDTESRIMNDYSASMSLRRAEKESYVIYKCSFGHYLRTAGKLQSIDGYFTACNGKIIIMFPTKEIASWGVDWLPCVSLINFSLGSQKINELTIESYSKVFDTEKPPIPLRIIDNLSKERCFFIHKPNDRYCRMEESVVKSSGCFNEVSNSRTTPVVDDLNKEFSFRLEKKKLKTVKSLPFEVSGLKNNSKSMNICTPEVTKAEGSRNIVEPENMEIDVAESKTSSTPKHTGNVNEGIRNEITSTQFDGNIMAETPPSTKANNVGISNDDEILQKDQGKTIKKPYENCTENFMEFTIPEPQFKELQSSIITTTTVPTDDKVSNSTINLPDKNLDNMKIPIVEEVLVPNEPVETIKAVTYLSSKKSTEIPLEAPDRPLIRINLPVAANSLVSNHALLNEFGDESDGESVPQPLESVKHRELHFREKSVESHPPFYAFTEERDMDPEILMMEDIDMVGITIRAMTEKTIGRYVGLQQRDDERNLPIIIHIIIVEINITTSETNVITVVMTPKDIAIVTIDQYLVSEKNRGIMGILIKS